MAKVTLGLRVEEETIAKLEELAELMTSAAVGAKVTYTTAARTALDRGIDVLRAELATKEKKTKK